jgi:cytochrome P450
VGKEDIGPVPPIDQTRVSDVDDDFDYNDQELTGYQTRLAPLRAEQGVVRLRFGSSTGLVLLRYADVRNAFCDDVRFSKSKALRPATFPFMGPNLMGYDGHEHRVKRALVSRAFRRRTIPGYVEPLLRPTAETLADDLAPLGEADLMAGFAKKYPFRIITRLLGLPPDDEDKMASWAVAMLDMISDAEGAMRANAEFTEYVAPLVDERRMHPGDDLLSTIVTEEVEGERLGDDEVFGFLRLLFPAGVDTTWLTLGSLMAAVLEHPEVHQRLLEDEEERFWAVEETLRWESTTGTEARLTTEDVVVSGVEIPAGELVRLAVPVANRDPEVFPDPDRWDLDRRPKHHLAFGIGRHFCLGASLARAELNVALEVLLRRLPNLRLLDKPRIAGVVLRGPRSLRLAWDAP